MTWSISAYGGLVELVSGDGFFGEGTLGCAVTGCMDDTACNYDAEATISGDCIYPELNEDCEGNFSCAGIQFQLDMYDLSGNADGWNGNSFSVIDWVTGEIVPGAGPFTFDEGEMGTAFACFPEDMVTGCYVMQIGGGDDESQVGWHLFGFEVFGSYVVDWSAGFAQEWTSAGGELVAGDSQTYQDADGNFVECEDPSGFCAGDYPDWQSGVGTYDTNFDGLADGYDIGYGCPCVNQDASNYVFDISDDPYGQVIPVDEQDQSDPCVYENSVLGCTDEAADNYNELANQDDGTCTYACLGSGDDADATVAELFGALGISDCPTIVAYVVENYGAFGYGTTEAACAWDGTGSPFGSFGFTIGSVCGCSCPDPVVPGCTDEGYVEYNPDANSDDGSCETIVCTG